MMKIKKTELLKLNESLKKWISLTEGKKTADDLKGLSKYKDKKYGITGKLSKKLDTLEPKLLRKMKVNEDDIEYIYDIAECSFGDFAEKLITLYALKEKENEQIDFYIVLDDTEDGWKYSVKTAENLDSAISLYKKEVDKLM